MIAGLAWAAPPDLPMATAFTTWGRGEHLRALVSDARRIAVLTGAGLSAASGLHTYRGKDGRWNTEEPVLYHQFHNDKTLRLLQWKRSISDHDAFAAALPNEGHLVLAEWAAAGHSLATQNIDGLHVVANDGAPVLELHGNGNRCVCVRCKAKTPIDDTVRARVEDGRSPLCPSCGFILMPDIVMFGGKLDPSVLKAASDAASACDLFVAVGTSLEVQPAAGLVKMAKLSGAKVAILVDGVTPHHHLADLLVAGDAVTALVAAKGAVANAR